MHAMAVMTGAPPAYDPVVNGGRTVAGREGGYKNRCRCYLTGNRFSRADVTVASFLAPFVRPQEMPVYRDLPLPTSLEDDCERWRDRPTMKWVRAQYRDSR